MYPEKVFIKKGVSRFSSQAPARPRSTSPVALAVLTVALESGAQLIESADVAIPMLACGAIGFERSTPV